MKALSIKQPWAHAILQCGKDIENRTWKTNVRGRVLIHASQKLDDLAMHYWYSKDVRAAISSKDTPPHADFFGCPEPAVGFLHLTGAILGFVTIVDCVTESKSKWFEGPYGYVLKDPVAFNKPIPCKGQLKFFDPPSDVMRKVQDEAFPHPDFWRKEPR